jgi:hypothetical protein
MAVVPGGLGRAKSDWSRGLISGSKSDDEADGLPVGAIEALSGCPIKAVRDFIMSPIALVL